MSLEFYQIQIQEKDQEIRRWKERALKVEGGLREVQVLVQETDELKMLLKETEKMHENSLLAQRDLEEQLNRKIGEMEERDRDIKAYKEDNILINDKLKQEIDQLKIQVYTLESIKREQLTQNNELTAELNETKKIYQEKLEKEVNKNLENQRKWDYQLEMITKETGQIVKEKEFYFTKELQRLIKIIELLKNEKSLLVQEIDICHQQLVELERQKNIENQLQLNQLDEKLYSQFQAQLDGPIRQQLEQKQKECKEFEINVAELQMKIGDMDKMIELLKKENEKLRQTMLQLQKQREYEDKEKEEQKKKEINQIKKYYETLFGQFERENKSLRQLLEKR